MTLKKHTNNLINESSPYLLQHAHNPVDWFPWSKKALSKAQIENKLIVISIGYAACHWCHVMEHESFEDTSVANVMNDFFVSIKVDREERPDIDQIYMDAAYLLTGRGGWPLNVIALPDARPVFAGTYFRKNDWLKILNYFLDLYRKEPQTFQQEAEKLTNALRSMTILGLKSDEVLFTREEISIAVKQLINYVDFVKGGTLGAPKFPMPNIYEFLLKYNFHISDDKVLKAITITLDNISRGGIYDHIGGGFARYSTDDEWKVPHFEKMLYDNAQLVSLYSNVFKVTKDEWYKKIVIETLEFVERELTDQSGGFYSSLDADSEGEEGKYYLWTKDEIHKLLGEKSAVFCDYYSVHPNGNWEGKNILFVTPNKIDLLSKHQITEKQFDLILSESKKILLKERSKKIRPGLDDKILTSWNALMLRGYANAYSAFGENKFLQKAIKNGKFISDELMTDDGRLNRNFKSGKSTINGFLDDYAFTIEAFISLYEATFDEQWIYKAKQLADYVLIHFYDTTSGMFYFTSDIDDPLITRKIDFSDNVTPSSNSSMAIGLIKLSKYFFSAGFDKTAGVLVGNMKVMILKNPHFHSNWLLAVSYGVFPYHEVAVVGDSFEEKKILFLEQYVPNISLAGGDGRASLELLKHKYINGRTLIYICEDGACQFPVEDFSEALKQIKS